MRHLLTGATSGIGLELARRLRDRGDALVLVVRDPAKATEFPDAEVLVADLTDAGAIAELQLPDGLDSVVHAAGIVELGAVADTSLASWRHQFDVNLLAPVALTQACLPALRAVGGTVVFVNSGAGLNAHAGWSAYAASKFGLRALADSLRAEEPSIRVTSVFPGRTATPMQAEVHRQEGKEYDESRWTRPETVADAVLHVLDLPGDATIPELVVRPRA
jgi:NAD(P)-dependent dehydrogenase (short-subunit alcohol dehydrogenase family)